MMSGAGIGLAKLGGGEWKLLEAVAHVLDIFDKATQRLCAANYPTLNAAVPVYNHLFNMLEDFGDACDGKDEADSGKSVDIIGLCTPSAKRTLSRRPFRPGGPWQALRVLREDLGRPAWMRSQ